jgi:hypothetical protein
MRLSNQLSNDPIDREGMSVDAGGRLRQGQAPNAAGQRGTDLASGRGGCRSVACPIEPVLADVRTRSVGVVGCVCLGREYLGWWHAC